MRPPADVSQLADRLAERSAAVRRRRRRTVGIVVGAATVVFAVVFALFFSPLFALQRERITINAKEGRLDVAQVRQIAEKEVGIPLPRLSTGALEQKLKAIPTVLEARVSRSWPNGITIAVTPRTAVAAVPFEGGVRLYDGTGVELGVEARTPQGLPTIKVEATAQASQIVKTVLAVLNSLGDLRPQVTGAGATGLESVEFTLGSGAKVRWGANKENDLKLAVLRTLMERTKASVYDVSTPRTPITQ